MTGNGTPPRPASRSTTATGTNPVSAVVTLRRGPGKYRDPEAPPEKWGGRRAQEYVAATLREYGRVCINCGLPGANSADHIIPRSERGAVYDLANLGPSHRSCNYSRQAKPLGSIEIPIENGTSWFTN